MMVFKMLNILCLLITLFSMAFPAAWTYSIGDRAGRAPGDENTIFYELFTRKNSETPQILRLNDLAALQSSNFNPNLPTKLFTHGWTGSAVVGCPAKDEYLKREDCNFISTDWSVLASGPLPHPADYPIIVKDNVPLAGQHTGKFLDFLIENTGISINLFHLVGHSLGAHVSGEAGESITSGRLPRITGLDPAGPFFFLNNTDNRLDISDALFVDIIHTDSGNLTGNELGFIEPIGHVDFYPNNGADQPGCFHIPGTARSNCDHQRAPTYFAESINSVVGFRGVTCDSWQDFLDGLCDDNGHELMGDPTPNTARGIYYLATNSESPFARG